MQTVSVQLVTGKIVLLRYDTDVPIEKGKVAEDFRLKAGLQTLRLCLENAKQVIIMGHLGRPNGREDQSLSVEPIYDWLMGQPDLALHLKSGRLKLLENLRFEPGESFNTEQGRSAQDKNWDYARKLAMLGEVFVNEAFGSYHQSASTTLLPTLLPHAAGLNFAHEVETLMKVKENPGRPLVIIIGGAKVEDKLPIIQYMSKLADFVLVGGKLAAALSVRGPVASVSQVRPRPSTGSGLRSTPESSRSAPPLTLSENILLAELNSEGTDITDETVKIWKEIINKAGMIVWNGPLGRIPDSEKGTHEIAQAIIQSEAESIVGGGDTVSYLSLLGYLGNFGFVSSGGGAMLEFLVEGTLPTIEVLK